MPEKPRQSWGQGPGYLGSPSHSSLLAPHCRSLLSTALDTPGLIHLTSNWGPWVGTGFTGDSRTHNRPHHPKRWWHGISVLTLFALGVCRLLGKMGQIKVKLKGIHYQKELRLEKASESTYLKWRLELHIMNSGKGLTGNSWKTKLLLKLVGLKVQLQLWASS